MPDLLLALLAGWAVQEADGTPASHPGFTLPTVDGGSGSLADHLGGKTVVFHFASW